MRIFTSSSIDYGSIKSDHNSNEIQITELTFGHNSLVISDDHMRYGDYEGREMEFLNVENVRRLEDLKSTFKPS